MKMEQGVPKRRQIKFRRWRITQKKAYELCSVLQSGLFLECEGAIVKFKQHGCLLHGSEVCHVVRIEPDDVIVSVFWDNVRENFTGRSIRCLLRRDVNNIKVIELTLVAPGYATDLHRTHLLNKHYVVHTNLWKTFLTHQCPLSPDWPQWVAKVMPRPVLLTQQAPSLPDTPHISFVFRDHSKMTPKEHLFFPFYLLRNNEYICSLHFTSNCSQLQWRAQEFCSGGGSTNSVEDRENGDLGAVAP